MTQTSRLTRQFSFITPIFIKGSVGWGVKTGLFFGCIGSVVVAIGWFIIPETARRTPAEIDEMFEKGVPPRKFRKYVTDVQRDLQEQERYEGIQGPAAQLREQPSSA